MTRCEIQGSGAIELYFYGELAAADRLEIDRHLQACEECRQSLEELRVIAAALSSRPDVSAPDAGDWSGFMARLDSAIQQDRREPRVVARSRVAAARAGAFTRRHRSYVGYLAMAALLTLVTLSVTLAVRSRASLAKRGTFAAAPAMQAAPSQSGGTDFAALSQEHFQRSKLVVLGLATKDPRDPNAADWTYERDLAGQLLSDTRMYRMAAEDRGLTSIAGVMRDLEVVLLQASLTDEKDPSALPQLQRLIQKRDLLVKMDLVGDQAGRASSRTKGI